jgi:hypothetical protein
MKVRHALYLTIIAGLLLPMSATPVHSADELIPMWVHRHRLIWTERASGYPDAITSYIHIRDATKAKVAGALVVAEWELPGKLKLTQSAYTNRQGIAVISVWAGPGPYRLCIYSVAKQGWDYRSDLDRDSACQECVAY